MRRRPYLIGVCLILAGGVAIALPWPGVPGFTIVAVITLLAAGSVGGYLLVLGGLQGRKRPSSTGVVVGRVVAYLVGLALLLPGMLITGALLHLLVTVGLGRDVEYMATVAMMILGPLLECGGVAVLVIAGRIRVDDAGGIQL